MTIPRAAVCLLFLRLCHTGTVAESATSHPDSKPDPHQKSPPLVHTPPSPFSLPSANTTARFHFRLPNPVDVETQLRPGAPWLNTQSSTSPEPETLVFGSNVVVAWNPSLLNLDLNLNLEPNLDLNLNLEPKLELNLNPDAHQSLPAHWFSTEHPEPEIRLLEPGLALLSFPDAAQAMIEADRLAKLPDAIAAYPVVRREAHLDSRFAPQPNDPNFPSSRGNVLGQWYLENRDPTNGTRLGFDLNIRAAWPYSRGSGVRVAVVDTGVELSHPELAANTLGQPHHNFITGSTNGSPLGASSFWAHGTEAAGLIAAEAGNNYAMAGLAPESGLASWVVFGTNTLLTSDDRLAESYQFALDSVAVRSMSWGMEGLQQKGPTALEAAALTKAFQQGRNGLGAIMVRSAGNDRSKGASCNDDGYPNDPRVITVGATWRDGRSASYSEPGACVLVSAPAGDAGGNGLFSTDLSGTDGVMFLNFFPPNEYLSGCVFNTFGFSGTSASAPLVAGICALILGTNPELSYRDVQQILILSSRRTDAFDADFTINGAGLAVSHSSGFGVPDAGEATRLAQAWHPRPPQQTSQIVRTGPWPIPDDGLRLEVTGLGIPPSLASVHCLPTAGPHPDNPTASLRLNDVGLATNVPTANIQGQAALIQRGSNSYYDKLWNVFAAGAQFAVIYNYLTNTSGAGCPGGDQLCLPNGADFAPIPAVFIGNSDGTNLAALFQNNKTARAALRVHPLSITFDSDASLSCEWVGLRVETDHPLRGDLRITLRSPSGTRSILQHYNSDTSPGPVDWTYYSAHHFFENTRGTWTAEITDEGRGATGNALRLTLILNGVPIEDSDADGLDDNWERAQFGNLAQGPADDPDNDGQSNLLESLLHTPALTNNFPLALDLSTWNTDLARLSWRGLVARQYEVLAGADPARLAHYTNVLNTLPETEVFVPRSGAANFFQVRLIP